VAAPADGPVALPVQTVAVTAAINGATQHLQGRVNETLAEVLRERLGLTGTKLGCDDGSCGTCTVLADGLPIYACMTLLLDCQDKAIETIEGLGSEERPHPLQVAFAENYAAQCGVCTPGAIMAAKALLDQEPDPSEDDVRLGLSGVLCRCGYLKIIEATLEAARTLRNGQGEDGEC
jgi:aerobic-type carbon monoxide dehydrogenase small subunit (CoxS/CutS family)